MCNKEIRIELKLKDIKQWQLADTLGISEFTLTRWLRKEIDDSRKEIIMECIKKIECMKGEK